MRVLGNNVVITLLFLLFPLVGSAKISQQAKGTASSDRVSFVGVFQSPSDVQLNRTTCQQVRDFFDPSGRAHGMSGERPAVCDKVADVVLGKANLETAAPVTQIHAANLVTDRSGRVVVTEPSTGAVHILDFEARNYKVIHGTFGDGIYHPYALAVDSKDNLYVTDPQVGAVLLFSADGAFKKEIGNYKGERSFEAPQSIQVDPESGRIYVSDAKSNFVIVFDHGGNKLFKIGKRGGGTGPSEFQHPKDLALHNKELFVLDQKNERIQVFDVQGAFRRELRPESLSFTAARGMAIDSEGLIYILSDIGLIGAFDPSGKLMFQFGGYGGAIGEFRNPSGIYIDQRDQLYVCDTGNGRVQIFQIRTASRIVSKPGK